VSAAIFNHPLRDPALTDRAADYLRQARHIRHVYRREPQKLHQSLRYLSACHDIATGNSRSSSRTTDVPATPRYVIDQTSTTIRDFANAVMKSMNGPILCYSQRVELMRHAKRIGLRTFDANLIIAAVQNRVDETLAPEMKQPESPKPMSWRIAITIGAVLQLGITVGVWWILH
jgi:hypothetical protein